MRTPHLKQDQDAGSDLYLGPANDILKPGEKVLGRSSVNIGNETDPVLSGSIREDLELDVDNGDHHRGSSATD